MQELSILTVRESRIHDQVIATEIDQKDPALT